MRKSASPEPSISSAIFGELIFAKPAGRQDDLDIARGIAIFLVVVGHVVAREMPAGNEWYAELKRLVYLFHMPLFMALAGISFAMSTPKFSNWPAVARFSCDRVERLLSAYLLIGLIVLGGKVIAQHYLHVDNAPNGSARDLWLLLFIPGESAAGFLWFAFVLMIYFATLPALFHLFGRYPAALLGGSLLFVALPWTNILMLDRVFEYLPFFALGMLAWACRSWWRNISMVTTFIGVGALVLILALSSSFSVPKWLAGIVSIVAVLALSQHLTPLWMRVFKKLGQASLAIYLLNTICIGLCKALMLKVIPWDGHMFLVFFPVLLCSGLIVPVVVRMYLPQIFPRLRRYL